MPELVDLWVESWQQAMPAIDFDSRRAWFIEHLTGLRDAGAQVVCAFDTTCGAMAGFVTINPSLNHLDQLAVAPRYWGTSAAAVLVDAARRRSSGEIWLDVNQDNPRAVRFYEKQAFLRESESINPRSGLKTWRYRWRARPQTKAALD
jgi:putative acetyltransferase